MLIRAFGQEDGAHPAAPQLTQDLVGPHASLHFAAARRGGQLEGAMDRALDPFAGIRVEDRPVAPLQSHDDDPETHFVRMMLALKQEAIPAAVAEARAALDAGLPSTKGAGQRFRTQAERAAAAEITLRTMLRMPFMVGAAFAFAYNIAVIPPAPPLIDWDATEPGEES